MSPGPAARNRAGILFLIGGVAVFSLQDLILKLLSSGYPLYEAMLVRSLTSIPILLVFVLMDGGLATLFTPGTRAMILRGLVMFLAYASYYVALAGLPLPTTVALYFSGPLFITLLSALVLRERVTPLAWLAVLAGFGGVIVIVQPGSSLFDWAAILPVISGLAYGVSMVAARRMGARETAAALAFWGNGVFLACALILAAIFGGGRFETEAHASLGFLTRGWVTPSLTDLGLMMACGVIAALGLWLLTQAYRVAEASVVAPFEYSGLFWSVLWGWVFWQHWPNAEGWTGIAMIAGAGLVVLWAEGRRGAAPA